MEHPESIVLYPDLCAVNQNLRSEGEHHSSRNPDLCVNAECDESAADADIYLDYGNDLCHSFTAVSDPAGFAETVGL